MQNSTPISGTFEFVVAPEDAGTRLDVFLVNQFRVMSRSHVRRLINANAVSVDGQHTKAAYLLRSGQTATITLPQLPQEGPVPEDVPIDILFEDDHLVAIDKPSGMVVHPSKGHWEGTLTSALAFHFKNLSSIGGPTRPGIVHRLDRETSGVMVVAKTDTAHVELARQFENRTVEKEYFAIVHGVPDRDRDIIRQPIGPHPYQREKMAIRVGHNLSREAETFYEVDQRFMGFASVRVFPKTGRTHQIRLHLAHIVRCFVIVCMEGNHASSVVSCSEAEGMMMIRSCLAVWHCMPGEFSYAIRRPRSVLTSPPHFPSIFRTYFHFSEMANRKRIHDTTRFKLTVV